MRSFECIVCSGSPRDKKNSTGWHSLKCPHHRFLVHQLACCRWWTQMHNWDHQGHKVTVFHCVGTQQVKNQFQGLSKGGVEFVLQGCECWGRQPAGEACYISQHATGSHTEVSASFGPHCHALSDCCSYLDMQWRLYLWFAKWMSPKSVSFYLVFYSFIQYIWGPKHFAKHNTVLCSVRLVSYFEPLCKQQHWVSVCVMYIYICTGWWWCAGGGDNGQAADTALYQLFREQLQKTVRIATTSTFLISSSNSRLINIPKACRRVLHFDVVLAFSSCLDVVVSFSLHYELCPTID